MNLRLLLDESDAAEEPKLISCKRQKNEVGDGVEYVVTLGFKGKNYTTKIYRDAGSQFAGWHENLPHSTKYQEYDGSLAAWNQRDAIESLMDHLKNGRWQGKPI
jgi:hypothetical protein